MKTYVFAYGTLCDAKVRKEVIGYETQTVPDQLKGYKIGWIVLDQVEYPILTEPASETDSISGQIFEVQDADGILTVSEKWISEAMKLIWTRMKLVVEPSTCVPLAAVMEYPEIFRNKTTGIILSGGNIDLQKLYGILYNPQLTGK